MWLQCFITASRVEHFDVHEDVVDAERQPLTSSNSSGASYGTTAALDEEGETTPWHSFARPPPSALRSNVVIT